MCNCCGGIGILMGVLGNLAWWRCRDCGIQYSTDAEEVAA